MFRKSNQPHFRSGLTVQRAVFVALAVAANVLTLPADADRHCLPAHSGYFAARQVLLERSDSCLARIQSAGNLLGQAVVEARICGCGNLIEALELMQAQSVDDGTDCDARETQILSAEMRLDELVTDCHH